MADPGWYPDPYGRYEMRWFDGSSWTADVADGGQTVSDPLGAFPAPTTPQISEPPSWSESTSVAPITPATADSTFDGPPVSPTGDTATTTAEAPGANFGDTLGPDARRRPDPALTTALGAGGGLLCTAGILALLGDSANGAALAALSALVFVAALFVRLRVPVRFAFAHAAAVAAALVAIPAFAIGLTESALDDGSVTGTLVLITVLYAIAWFTPGFRGRPTLLAASLLALMATAASVIGSAREECRFDCSPLDDAVSGLGGWLSAQAWVYLVMAALFLTAVALLDQRGWQGVATSFSLVSIVASAIGLALVLDSLSDAGGAMIVLLVGVAVAIVGSRGARRALTWWGAILTTIGAAALPLITFEATTQRTNGMLLLLAGAALIIVPFGISRLAAANAPSATPLDPPEHPPQG